MRTPTHTNTHTHYLSDKPYAMDTNLLPQCASPCVSWEPWCVGGWTLGPESRPSTINTSAVLGSEASSHSSSLPHPPQQIVQHSLIPLPSLPPSLSCSRSCIRSPRARSPPPPPPFSPSLSHTRIWLSDCSLRLDAACANVSVFFSFNHIFVRPIFPHLSICHSVFYLCCFFSFFLWMKRSIQKGSSCTSGDAHPNSNIVLLFLCSTLLLTLFISKFFYYLSQAMNNQDSLRAGQLIFYPITLFCFRPMIEFAFICLFVHVNTCKYMYLHVFTCILDERIIPLTACPYFSE